VQKDDGKKLMVNTI